MTFIVTITSQGQITIPAKIRRVFNLDETKKALVSIEKQRIIIEPEPDISMLSGSLYKYAIKSKPIDKIIKLEKKAIGLAIINRYKKRLKKN